MAAKLFSVREEMFCQALDTAAGKKRFFVIIDTMEVSCRNVVVLWQFDSFSSIYINLPDQHKLCFGYELTSTVSAGSDLDPVLISDFQRGSDISGHILVCIKSGTNFQVTSKRVSNARYVWYNAKFCEKLCRNGLFL